MRAIREEGRAGFSLIELITALAMGAVLLGFVFQALGTTTRIWSGVEGKLEVHRDARAAMLRVSQDVQSLVRSEAIVALRIEPDSEGGAGGDRLTALVCQEKLGMSQVCGLQLAVEWNEREARFEWKRSWMEHGPLLERIENEGGWDWFDADQATVETLGACVWNVRWTPLDADGGVMGATAYSNQHPAALELEFAMVSGRAARGFAAMGLDALDWAPGGIEFQNVMEPHVHRFKTRFWIRTGGPWGER